MTGVVFPGETVVTRIWEDGDNFILEASTKERGEQVLGNCLLTTS